VIAFAEVTLKPRIIDVPSFTVVGIAARTNNARESGPEGVIGKQWQGFMSEQLLEKIPNKLSPEIYSVYTDYASDAHGDYTHILGAKVKDGTSDVPAGMVEKVIPAGRYAVFTSARGPVADVVVATWKQIWTYYQSGQNGKRAYKADFELYDQRAANPADAQVDIYIGLE
jgi:predicted transcriptional regulator YdeE